MLVVRDIHAEYGRVEVLKGIALEVGEGEVVCLLGANGAGKSTLLKVISGLNTTLSGSISFLGQEMTKRKADEIVRAGISQVPEGRQIFASLTVQQNLLLGAYAHGTRRANLQKLYGSMCDLFPILKERLSGKAGSLSGGEQQMLAIARGLMSQPKLLLLDEPSLGLAPLIVQQVFQIIAGIRAQGTTVLLVEQNAHMALSIGDRGYVLETGRLVAEGTPEALWNNDELRAAYLGGRKMVR